MGMFINVKLSDYGISQWSSLIGLTAVKGTAGYQAPEVTQRNTRYDFKVIKSFIHKINLWRLWSRVLKIKM